MTAFNSDCLCL